MSDSKKKSYGFSFLRRALRRGNTLLLGEGQNTATITGEQLLPFLEDGKRNPKALEKADRLRVLIVPVGPKPKAGALEFLMMAEAVAPGSVAMAIGEAAEGKEATNVGSLLP